VALSVLGTARAYQGDLKPAETTLQASIERARAVGLSWIEVLSVGALGQLALGRGDLEQADAYILESHRLAQGLDPWTRGMALTGLGDLLRARAEYEAAGRAYQEALDLFTSLDTFKRYIPQGALHNLGYVATAAGHTQRGAALFLESADIYRTVGSDRRGFAECVVGLACTAARAGEFELAARLFGSAEATLEELGTLPTPANRADHERGLATLAAGAPAELVAAERRIGRDLPLEGALEQARVLARDAVTPGAVPQPVAGGLTEREREVAMLMARGLRNRDIADVLVITPKTAANHVQRVLDKLGVRSRTEVAARAEELGLRVVSTGTTP
jgi:ATP/maltotriose-dependent transcriptional regulator MalT